MLPKEYFVGKTVQGMSREYRVKEYIGEGGFSFVYKGIPLSPLPDQASVIAVKVFTENTNPQQLKDFLREARRMAQLKHQHIIPLYDVSLEEVHYVPQGATQEVTEDTPLIVMGYAPQGSVRRLKPENSIIPVSPSRVADIIKQTAEALQYAHDRGIMHLDVKPENLLLGTATQVLLSDFGNARQTSTGASAQNQPFIGTPEYMSPEQFDKHPVPATDQYSLGIVTYELLTARVPFEGQYPAIKLTIKGTPPPSFKNALHGGTTGEILDETEEAVMKALAKQPKDRYPSVADYAEDFYEKYKKGEAAKNKNRRSFPQPSPQPPVVPNPVIPPNPGIPPAPVVQPHPGGVQGQQAIHQPQQRNPNRQPGLQRKKLRLTRRLVLIGAVGLAVAGIGEIVWHEASKSPLPTTSQAENIIRQSNQSETNGATNDLGGMQDILSISFSQEYQQDGNNQVDVCIEYTWSNPSASGTDWKLYTLRYIDSSWKVWNSTGPIDPNCKSAN